MPVSIVIGAQWGDEGKGKIVDLLSEDVSIVGRYQGGANAGHTIKWEDQEFVLHLVPSGIFQKDTLCVIGNGVVVDPVALLEEVNMIKKLGYDASGRLFISKNAHLIMPWHKKLDQAREQKLSAGAIGTTGRGIGPAYEDKFARNGIRVGDLLDPVGLKAKIEANLTEKNAILTEIYQTEPIKLEEVLALCKNFEGLIEPYIEDTSFLINQALKSGKNVLAEGAQGALLDIDFGTYPYVTSSSPTAGGCCTGLGIPPTAINRVIGIVKAYTTRVGNGPFPTELLDEKGENLRATGHEFGATTGRPRRCGWLDLVALDYSCTINGCTDLAITKLDVLSGQGDLDVCVAYEIDGKTTTQFPNDVKTLEKVKPVYQTFAGWDEDLTNVKSYDDLPANARIYLDFVTQKLGVKISIVSTGPRREETMVL